MTTNELDLDAIRERARRCAIGARNLSQRRLYEDDIPGLIREVRKLRDEAEALTSEWDLTDSQWQVRCEDAEERARAAEAKVASVEALAVVQAESCRQQHRADHAKNWQTILDICADGAK